MATSDNRRRQLIARTAAQAALALRRIWVTRGGLVSGVEVGLVLTEVHFTPNPWVSAQYVTDRLTGIYSPDTVRRRLEDMVDHGSVEVVEHGGRKLYRSREQAAEATIGVVTEAYRTLCD